MVMRFCYLNSLLIALILGGCNKSSSTKATTTDTSTSASDSGSKKVTAGVEASSSDSITIAGSLNLSSLGLRDASTAPDSVLMFRFFGGSPYGDPTEVKVNADGTFSTDLSKSDERLTSMNDVLAASAWTDALKKEVALAFGMTVDKLAEVSFSEAQDYAKQLTTQYKEQGGPVTLLVAYKKSTTSPATLESKKEEASTFRFVGLPNDGGNLIGLPTSSIKGNLTLGTVGSSSDSADSATAELKSDTTVFDLPTNAIESMTSMGEVLKAVKNVYINGTSYDVEPFYAWSGVSTDNAKDQWFVPSTTTTFTYSGMGQYIRTSGTDLTYDALCNATQASRTAFEIIPPSDVVVTVGGQQGTTTYNAANPFTNMVELTSSKSKSQNPSDDTCSGGSFYFRDDSLTASAGTAHDGMANIGTGGGIQTRTTGFWKIQLTKPSETASTIAYYDIAAGDPYASDDADHAKPKVFFPSVKITSDASTKEITKVELQFYRYDTATSKYVQVTDLTPARQMLKEISFSFGAMSEGGGSSELSRGYFSFPSTSATGSDAYTMSQSTFAESPDSTEAMHLTFDATVPNGWTGVSYISISYMMGSMTYRWELR